MDVYEKGSLASMLKSLASQTLVQLLKKIHGDKDLVITADLIPILDAICGFQVLKDTGVVKVYKLEPRSAVGQAQRRCYLIRPTVSEVKHVCDQITQYKIGSNRGRDFMQFYVIFVPRKTHICDVMLETEGVYGDVTLLEFPLPLIPLDSDLLSLEMDDFFHNYYLYGDQTQLQSLANSLFQLQQLAGVIPFTYGQGRCAKIVSDMLHKLIAEDVSSPPARDSMIRNLIIIDRDIDYASTLLSQLTYEGLLDETFGIKSGRVEFGPEVTKCPDKPIKHPVSSFDTIYRDIRDSHFSSVFASLKEKGQRMRAKYDQRHDMNLTGLKDFVAKDLKILQTQHKSLSLHISACEVIMEKRKELDFADQLRVESNLIEGHDTKESISFIEEIIIRQSSLYTSLRLMCLLSLTQDGLASKDYKYLTTLFLHSYGHEHVVTLFNLKKLGLFYEQNQQGYLQGSSSSGSAVLANKVTAAAMSALARKSQFRTIAKKLNLIPVVEGSYDVRNPIDCGYVFGGAYIPVICRLIELLITNRTNNEEAVKLLPGETVYRKAKPSSIPTTGADNNVVLVYFIGGVTFAEVSALRFLAKQKGLHILVATTSVTNGNSHMRQLMPQI